VSATTRQRVGIPAANEAPTLPGEKQHPVALVVLLVIELVVFW
jgi:hypothetical protein